MPLTTYTSGEVLTAASLNANLSFAASSPASGLALISATTIGTTVASVTVTGAFSATYDNYFVTVSGGVASTSNSLNLTLGSAVTNYFWSGNTLTFARVVNQEGDNGGTFFGQVVYGSTNSLAGQFFLQNPFATDQTTCIWNAVRTVNTGLQIQGGGVQGDATSYTAFTLTATTGTITGGTIRVYGIANS